MKHYVSLLSTGLPNHPNVKTNYVEITEKQHDIILEIVKNNVDLGAEELKS